MPLVGSSIPLSPLPEVLHWIIGISIAENDLPQRWQREVWNPEPLYLIHDKVMRTPPTRLPEVDVEKLGAVLLAASDRPLHGPSHSGLRSPAIGLGFQENYFVKECALLFRDITANKIALVPNRPTLCGGCICIRRQLGKADPGHRICPIEAYKLWATDNAVARHRPTDLPASRGVRVNNF